MNWSEPGSQGPKKLRFVQWGDEQDSGLGHWSGTEDPQFREECQGERQVAEWHKCRDGERHLEGRVFLHGLK